MKCVVVVWLYHSFILWFFGPIESDEEESQDVVEEDEHDNMMLHYDEEDDDDSSSDDHVSHQSGQGDEQSDGLSSTSEEDIADIIREEIGKSVHLAKCQVWEPYLFYICRRDAWRGDCFSNST